MNFVKNFQVSHDPSASNDFTLSMNGLDYSVKKREENKYDINHTSPDSSNFEKVLEKTSSGTIQKNDGIWGLTTGIGLKDELVKQIGEEIDKRNSKP